MLAKKTKLSAKRDNRITRSRRSRGVAWQIFRNLYMDFKFKNEREKLMLINIKMRILKFNMLTSLHPPHCQLLGCLALTRLSQEQSVRAPLEQALVTLYATPAADIA